MTTKSGEYRPPQTAAELVQRYQAGERTFPKTQLSDDCIDVSMPGIDLSGSTLRLVFSDVDLSDASFVEADLAFCHFDGNLSRANFERAELTWANFGWSNLTGANFKETDLRHVEFKSSELTNCNFSSAQLDETSLLDVSIVSLCESSNVVHNGPSYVDHRTIIKSVAAPSLKEFLLRIGMPAIFVGYMVDCARSMDRNGVSSMLQSTFISYGGPDEAFARRLYRALENSGVRTFFFPEDASAGVKLNRLMREGVNTYDRVILICSKNSLTRKGVLNEIEETLQREARDGGASYLIPVRLDDYVFNGWTPPNPGTAQSVRDRVVADFTGVTNFDAALIKLVSALKKPSL